MAEKAEKINTIFAEKYEKEALIFLFMRANMNTFLFVDDFSLAITDYTKDYSKLNIEGVGSYSSVQYVCTLVYMALFYAQGGDKSTILKREGT